MKYLSSMLTATTPEERQQELEEKITQFSPDIQRAIRQLMTDGYTPDNILYPVAKNGITYLTEDWDDPWELVLLDDDSWDLRTVPREREHTSEE